MIPKSSKGAYYIKLLVGSALAIHLSIFVIKPWALSEKNNNNQENNSKKERPKHLTGTEIGLATLLGVLAGTYIWKPAFANYYKEKKEEAPANPTEN